MGLFLRKAITFGPIRFNLSKAGMGITPLIWTSRSPGKIFIYFLFSGCFQFQFRYNIYAMDITQKAAEILKEAEEKLAALAAKASSAREYETASAVLRLAFDVKELADQAQALRASDRPEPPPPAAAGRKPEPLSAGRAAGTPRRRRKGAYPKFRREGQNIVKTGWSKAGKKEYQHKAPRAVLDVLVTKLETLGKSGRTFTMEQVLPLRDTDGNEVPPYQVYVWMAWLRSTGLVKQHGRKGYTATDTQVMVSRAGRLLASVAQR